MSRIPGYVYNDHGGWFWRIRRAGKDTREHLGSDTELKTRRAAVAERDRRWAERNPVQQVHGTALTVAQAALLYDRLRIKVSQKPSGARASRSRLFKHIVPVLGHLPLMQVDAMRTQEMIAALTAQQLSRKSIDSILATLSCLLDFARQSGYPAPRLDRKLIRLPPVALSKAQRWFTPEEAQQIVEHAPWPWRAAFGIAASLGLRCGEVLGLRWIDVDFEQRIVRVRQNAVDGHIQTVKSANSKADLPMPESLCALLREYEGWCCNSIVIYASQDCGETWARIPQDAAKGMDSVGTTLLFADESGRPYTGTQIRNELAAVLKHLGIAHGGMKAFRHMVASSLFASGATAPEVKNTLRHGRIDTTMIYTHTVTDAARNTLEKSASKVLTRGSPGAADIQHSPGNSGESA